MEWEQGDMKALPNELKVQRTLFLSYSRQKEELARELEGIRNTVRVEVATAKDDAKKNLYGNEFLRAAEVEQRLEKSADYQKKQLELRQTEASIEGTKIEIQFLQDRMTVFGILARMAGD